MHDDGETSTRRPAGLLLVVGTLGVVYGDLGTSPLYAIREAFESPAHRLAVDEVNVLGADATLARRWLEGVDIS